MLENRIKKTADKITSLRSKMDALKDVKIPTEEYKEVSSQIAKVEQKISDLQAQQERFLATGGKANSSAYKKMEYDLEELRNSLPYLQGELQDLVDTGKAFTLGSDTQEYANMEQQMEYLQNDLSALVQKHDEVVAKQGGVSDGYKKIGNVAKKAFSSIGRFLNKTKSHIASFGKSLKNIAQKIFPLFNKSAKKSGSAFSSFGARLKSTILSLLVFNQITKAFDAMIAGVKEGFNNLALYSNQTNANLSTLISGLAQLKNSLATAFDPILTIVTPALTQLISLLSQATSYVAQFMSAITGKSTYTKAIKVEKDYAESLKGTADAAKEAEGSLSAYDKLNTIQKEKGKSGAEDTAIPEFEEQEIESPISNLAERIKEAWKKADFTDIGRSLAEKLKAMLENIPWDEIKQKAYNLGKSLATLLNGVFQTEELGERIGITIAEALNTALNFAYGFIHNFDFSAFGRFVGDGINGAFLAFDWQLLALTLAEAINGIFLSLLEFSKTVKWSEIGAVIAGAIRTFFKEWDPQVMADGISAFIIGILDSLIAIVEKTDWKLVGQKIGQLVTDIKWDEMAVKLGELLAKAINGAFEALIAFVETVDWWEVGKAIIDGIVTFIEELDFGTMGEAISSVAKGFLDLLTGALEGVSWVEVGKMLWEKLVDLVTGIDWGGIISKAIEFIGSFHGMAWGLLVGILTGIIEDVAKWIDEKMQELGDFTVEGLLKGIMDAITGIATWIKEHIFDPFIKGFKEAFGIHSPSTVMAEMGTYIIQGLLEGLRSLVENVIQFFVDLKEKIVTKLTELKESAVNKANEIKQNVVNAFNNLKQNAINAFNALKSSVASIWNGIVGSIQSAVSKIKDSVKSALEAITSVKETEISYSGTRASSYAKSNINSSNANFRAASIPHLATGAVIPPNREFLAVLGDQKRGTNIETPLDTMIDAFKQALKEMNGGSEKIELTTMLDSDVLEKKMIEIDRKHKKRTGKPLLA